MKYELLASLYQSLSNTTKRLEKTKILSDFLKTVPKDDIERVMLLVQGIVFPSYDHHHLGMSSKLIVKVLQVSTGATENNVIKSWKESGDLGDTAGKLLSKKTQQTFFTTPLTVNKVFTTLQAIASLEGSGSVDQKVHKVSELLSSATSLEATYIVRTVLEDLRVGLGEGTLRDAIAWTFFADDTGLVYDEKENKITFKDDAGEESREKYERVSQALQHAYDVTNDFSQVAVLSVKGLSALEEAPLTVGVPTKVMLFIKAKSIEDGFERVGTPCAIEIKYDGFRVLIHKQGTNVNVYTRRLDDVTNQFPDIVEAVRTHVKAKDCILDAEAIGYDPKTLKHMSFQHVSRRIKRKHNIAQLVKDLPIELDVFDVLYYKESLLNEPYTKRRDILTTIIPTVPRVIRSSEQIVTSSVKEAESFYKKSLTLGFEGVMMKQLGGIYKPGARVGYGVKVKPTMETLDCVIVGAEWGEGKRSEWFASFTIAVSDGEHLVEIGKVGTGIKEKPEEGLSFKELTEELQPNVTKKEGRGVTVKPTIILEIGYEEIQQSPSYSSGYALRFPRVIRLREDKGIEEISTLDDVRLLSEHQRGRNKQ